MRANREVYLSFQFLSGFQEIYLPTTFILNILNFQFLSGFQGFQEAQPQDSEQNSSYLSFNSFPDSRVYAG